MSRNINIVLSARCRDRPQSSNFKIEAEVVQSGVSIRKSSKKYLPSHLLFDPYKFTDASQFSYSLPHSPFNQRIASNILTPYPETRLNFQDLGLRYEGYPEGSQIEYWSERHSRSLGSFMRGYGIWPNLLFPRLDFLYMDLHCNTNSKIGTCIIINLGKQGLGFRI